MNRSALPASAAVIVGGGSGNRFGGDKLTVSLAGKPLIGHTLSAFEGTVAVSAIVLVVPPGREEEFRTIAREEGIAKLTSVIPGGEHRHESVRRGLEALPSQVELVAIHDAARPLITPDLITRCLEIAAKEGASALAAPVTDTLHRINASGCAAGTVDRTTLRAMQTPQVFRAAEIRDLLASVSGKPTDEVSVAIAEGKKVSLVEHHEPNLKVTWPQDVVMAEALLRVRGGKRERKNEK
ncbi:MAG: 2-C-methyl-D-erythritol 4-phosphate cytidylyltransferase [Verrucomicrobiota bacterium]|jgi:2-C-methyl-D-erythritol 4-phosphate cytidylyltransferase